MMTVQWFCLFCRKEVILITNKWQKQLKTSWEVPSFEVTYGEVGRGETFWAGRGWRGAGL